MRLARFGVVAVILAALGGCAAWLFAQDAQHPVFRVKVDMVVLSFTVTDSKGKYVNGLKPSDFKITEDGIVQKVATFGEGNKPVLQVLDDGAGIGPDVLRRLFHVAKPASPEAITRLLSELPPAGPTGTKADRTK